MNYGDMGQTIYGPQGKRVVADVRATLQPFQWQLSTGLTYYGRELQDSYILNMRLKNDLPVTKQHTDFSRMF